MSETGGMQTGLVIFAKNVEMLSTFYSSVLSLEVVEINTTHHVLQGTHLEIVVHAIPASVSKQITISIPPQVRSNNAIKPSFYVDDLQVAHSATGKFGGSMKPVDSAWRIRGALVLDGWDPEGNVVQFKQRIAD